MQRVPVWDSLVRVTHWGVAALVLAELTVLDEDWLVHQWASNRERAHVRMLEIDTRINTLTSSLLRKDLEH